MTQGEVEEPKSLRQRLGVELRRLRILAGLSQRDMAARANLSQSKVSRIENGDAVPTLPQVKAWAAAAGASEETRSRLVELTEAAVTDVQTWRAAFRPGVTHLQDKVRAREASTKALLNFQPTLVPGLLQTAEYARRVFPLVDVEGRQDVAAAVAGRLQRQQALYDPSRRFEFLITEAALRWRPGPVSLLVAQLAHISSISTLENVTIGVIPLDVEAVAAPWHGFVIYESGKSDEDAYVVVETMHAELTINDPQDVEIYRRLWERFRSVAFFGDEARALLSRIAEDVRGRAA